MKDNNTNKIINDLEISPSKRFNNRTKIKSFQHYKNIPHEDWPDGWKRIYYKSYPRMKYIKLPMPHKPKWSLDKALKGRASTRDFTSKSISTTKLSSLLYYSGGLKILTLDNTQDKRFYPSAGARYPLEIYPFIFKVDNINSAIYHYHLKSHSLEEIYNKSIFSKAMAQFDQTWIQKVSLLLVVTAVFDRTENKYNDRGLRHIYTEYGHFAQNVSLIAEELGLGACLIGGFIDDGLNKLLDLDPIDESTIGVIAIGTI